MWGKQCHKPSAWEKFLPPIYGNLRDGLSFLYPHYLILIQFVHPKNCVIEPERFGQPCLSGLRGKVITSQSHPILLYLKFKIVKEHFLLQPNSDCINHVETHLDAPE